MSRKGLMLWKLLNNAFLDVSRFFVCLFFNPVFSKCSSPITTLLFFQTSNSDDVVSLRGSLFIVLRFTTTKAGIYIKFSNAEDLVHTQVPLLIWKLLDFKDCFFFSYFSADFPGISPVILCILVIYSVMVMS